MIELLAKMFSNFVDKFILYSTVATLYYFIARMIEEKYRQARGLTCIREYKVFDFIILALIFGLLAGIICSFFSALYYVLTGIE